jgi:SAM-dependent methyltransferase
VHEGMVAWCREHLSPCDAAFEFAHHDVFELGFNPGAPRAWAPLAAESGAFSLAIAWSVFTHVTEQHAGRYLRELRRILRPDGVLVSTWFLFDKRDFPMMQPFQNALFVNDVHPTNAVIFDRTWLYKAARTAGLVVARADPPIMRGFQWRVQFRPVESGAVSVDLPDDTAPYGFWVAPTLPADAHRIGRD